MLNASELSPDETTFEMVIAGPKMTNFDFCWVYSPIYSLFVKFTFSIRHNFLEHSLFSCLVVEKKLVYQNSIEVEVAANHKFEYLHGDFFALGFVK